MVTRSVLTGHRMMHWRTWPPALHLGLALLGSVAFFGAGNYCTLEAFQAPPAHHERVCHAGSAAHHADESSPQPAHHHEGGSRCCVAMQAIAASRLDVHLASPATRLLHALTHERLGSVYVRAAARLARGVGPPLRAPMPAQPFYRTAFASHAPPVCLS